MSSVREQLRDELIEMGQLQRKTITLTLHEKQVSVDIRALGVKDRGDILNQCMISVNPDDPAEEEQTIDLAKMMPLLIQRCTLTPGTDELVFDSMDLDIVATLSAQFTGPLFTEASRMSGLDGASKKSAEGNLNAIPV